MSIMSPMKPVPGFLRWLLQTGPIDPYYNTFNSNPCYNMFFWMWLMETADANERAAWAYNHRSNISDTEWQALCKKDSNLEARVKQLEGRCTG